MMRVIHDLSGAGVRLDLEDGALVSRGRAGAIMPELAEGIRAHRDELVELLSDDERLLVEYAGWLFDAEVVEPPVAEPAPVEPEPERVQAEAMQATFAGMAATEPAPERWS